MSAIGRARAWIHAVVLRRNTEREMHEEMAAHVAQAAARFMVRGLSEREALYAARREFGNIAGIQEEARDSRGGRWVSNLVTDVRYSFRHFARTPLTTLTIVFTLMLGVGINSALFSVVEGVTFRSPPGVPDSLPLVVVQASKRLSGQPDIRERLLSYRELMAYGAEPVFESVAGVRNEHAVVDMGEGKAGTRVAPIGFVTPNFFETLGIPMRAGAGFLEKDFASWRVPEMTVVLTEDLAQYLFETTAAALGRQVTVNGIALTVAGVAPSPFTGTTSNGLGQLLWIPLSAMPAVTKLSGVPFANNDSGYFQAVARLAPGTTRRTALLVVKRVANLHTVSPRIDDGWRSAGTELVSMRGQKVLQSKTESREVALGWLAFAVFDIVFLLVCTTTVSSLLVGLAIRRRREIAVRLAMGASRGRLVRQLLTETSIMAMAGGAGGLFVFWLIQALGASLQVVDVEVKLTWSMAVFTALFVVVTALLSGMSPALHASRYALADVLKDEGTGGTARSRLQRGFVAAHLALAQPLLVCIAMFAAFLFGEISLRPQNGLDDELIIATFDTYTGFPRGVWDTRRLDAVQRRLAGLSGVRAVVPRIGSSQESTVSVIGSSSTSRQDGHTTHFQLPASSISGEADHPRLFQLAAMPIDFNYLKALDIPIVAGRGFVPSDTALGITPIIVGRSFAKEFLGGASPLEVRLCRAPCRTREDTLQIIGVVADGQIAVVDDDHTNDSQQFVQVFRPISGAEPVSLLIRTSVTPGMLFPSIRAATRAESPSIVITSMETVAERNDRMRNSLLMVSSLFAGAGLFTLLLGCVGLYAVVALAVHQRQREVGVRIALGARPSQVVALFFRSGIRLSIVGLALGMPLSAATIHLLATQADFPSSNIVPITICVAALVVAVAALATWIPARSAASVSPAVTLRAE